MSIAHETEMVGAVRIGQVRADAKAVRRTVAALSRSRNESLPKIGVHLYPRSLSYQVDTRGAGTHITMYGSNVHGRTVRLVVRGYRPYMFVRLPADVDVDADAVRLFVEQLNSALLIVALQPRNGCIGAATRTALANARCQPIVHHQLVDAISMKASGPDRGFNGERAEHFVQLFMYSPTLVRAARDLLEHVYDERALALGQARDYAQLVVDAVVRARERSENATPDMDVKGRVRQDGTRLKPTQQRLADAALTMRSLADFSHADKGGGGGNGKSSAASRKRKKAAGGDDGSDDDDDPWNDQDTDVRFDDTGLPDDELQAMACVDPASAAAEPAGLVTDRPRIVAALRASMARVDAAQGVTAQRSLRLVDDAPVEVYEADVDFTVRYLIDAGFKPEECVIVEGDGAQARKQQLNDYDFSCDWRSLRRHADERFQNTIVPQVCMSFDCEMETGIDGAFPKAETERVLQICCVMFDPVSDSACEHVVRRAFVLDTVDLAAVEARGFRAEEVYSFGDESAMLESFSEFTRFLQPDMLTGWNIENFDLSYLVDRANVIGCANRMQSLCRREGAMIRVAERAFSSSAHGTHLYKEVSGEGLWVWDLFQSFKRSTTYKLRSYSLEAVSNTFLGDRKEDVSYAAINGLQTTAQGRAKLMRYCMKDALLPARLIGKLSMLVGNVELSRLNGVPMDMICRRGLQIRLKSSLYREGRYARTRRLFYTRTSADRLASAGTTYAGAHVEPPVIGYHDEVVVTLDFKSLYPAIIVLLWMCISTLLPGRSIAERMARFGFDMDDFWPAECDALPGDREDQPAFMKSSSMPDIGMVPRILLRLLAERKRVKKLMAAAEEAGNEFLRAMYDMRQLAIKLNCNAIYGVFGAASSFAFCPEIAAMVTALGRMFIAVSKRLVEEHFTIANGYPFNAQVVYGDTDSIFVKLHVPPGAGERITIEQSARYGQEMAEFVTAWFKSKYGDRADNIMELEFEKSFSKIIFYAKKRYVGWKWELKFDKALGCKRMQRKAKPDASGMETERRDSTLLVSEGVREVLKMLLSDEGTRLENKELVRAFIVDEMVAPFEAGTIPWNRLVQSKQFRMRVAEYTCRGQSPPIHILLAQKLDERLGAGSDGTYMPGDRIEYCVLQPERPGQKTSELAEDPDYAWRHRLPLSREHYIDNQVHGTMARVLEPVLLEELSGGGGATRKRLADFADNADELLDEDEYEERKERRRKRGMAAYRAFISSRPAKRQHVQVEASQARGLAAFATAVVARCRLCGAAGTDMCARHTAEERAALDGGVAAKRQKLEDERDQGWRRCTACAQQWRAEDEPERAAALPPPTPGVDVEDAVTCKTKSCNFWWERRTTDRMLE